MNYDFPIRINRYLFMEKICSRREADRLIMDGDVTINGRTALLGQQVNKDDKVSVNNHKKSKISAKKYYVLFNKPVNVVSHNPQQNEKSATSFFNDIPAKLSPLGRLDKASRGLMLFSNDGLIVDRMLNPKYDHEKEYLVMVDKRIDKHFLEKLRAGVTIEGYKTKPATASKVDPRSMRIVLTEGKKHQIRRMCAACGYQVKDLKRVRIGDLRLGTIRPGKYKILAGLEELKFLQSIDALNPENETVEKTEFIPGKQKQTALTPRKKKAAPTKKNTKEVVTRERGNTSRNAASKARREKMQSKRKTNTTRRKPGESKSTARKKK